MHCAYFGVVTAQINDDDDVALALNNEYHFVRIPIVCIALTTVNAVTVLHIYIGLMISS